MKTDEAYSALCEIKSFAENHVKEIETEQDARFQLIDRIITEVLFWPRELVKTEKHAGEGRIDYLLRQNDKNKLVIEAKRFEHSLIDSKGTKLTFYKYNGPAARTATPALKQAEGYCLDVGVQFCAITNGFEWIGHWGMRGDGRMKSEYKIIAFPSLTAIQEEFSKFYEIFSCEGVCQDLYKIYLNESEGISIHQSEELYSIRDTHQPSMLSKSAISRDIDKIFTKFFSSMSGDDDPEMLINCFVESKESKETDLSLQKIAKNIIEQIDYVGCKYRAWFSRRH